MQPAGNQSPSWDECVEILERLPAMPVDNRVEAVERLVRNPSPGIREQALRIGASVLPDSRLTEYLRDPADAALRNAGSEIFRLRGVRSLPVVAGLLQDSDPDVVLQAVLILDRLRDPRALEPLHAMLGHADPNVRQEAILAIGHLGDARSIPYLLPFLKMDFWVQMAAVQALGDLRSPEAVPPLAEQLTDPLVGSVAAEALARIGGAPAFHALASHWPAGGVEIDDETMLGLLAHVLEGLPHPEEIGALPGGLREALSARLHDRSPEVRTAAARCLLVLGPSPWDEAAVEALSAPGRPAALARRRDLVGPLLKMTGEPRAWGFQLAATFPQDVPAEAFLAAVREAAELPGPAAVPAPGPGKGPCAGPGRSVARPLPPPSRRGAGVPGARSRSPPRRDAGGSRRASGVGGDGPSRALGPPGPARRRSGRGHPGPRAAATPGRRLPAPGIGGARGPPALERLAGGSARAVLGSGR